MNKDILQKFIKQNGNYLLGNRYIKGYGNSKDCWEAILLAPDVEREFCVEDIGTLPYDKVVSFGDEEIKTIIHLGKTYSPFQYGIRRKDFISLEEVTCNPMKLIVKCYQENISDYYKVIEVMKALSQSESDKEEALKDTEQEKHE